MVRPHRFFLSSESDKVITTVTNGHLEHSSSTSIKVQVQSIHVEKSPELANHDAARLGEHPGDEPQSPFSINRAIIRDLTLPVAPNLDIPLSPPGSPLSGIDKKFEGFLDLKHKGIHFNEKLARSSALKNPSLLKKLMDFAGMKEDEQYLSTLPKELWDPTGFPNWTYKEKLAESHQEVLKQQARERAKTQRESIEFVSASASGESSRAGTPASTSSKVLRGSAAERVMAGLDRERLKSPQTSALPSRSNSGRRRRSRSPQQRRKRSRSR